jgi:hypothetical protein
MGSSSSRRENAQSLLGMYVRNYLPTHIKYGVSLGALASLGARKLLVRQTVLGTMKWTGIVAGLLGAAGLLSKSDSGLIDFLKVQLHKEHRSRRTYRQNAQLMMQHLKDLLKRSIFVDLPIATVGFGLLTRNAKFGLLMYPFGVAGMMLGGSFSLVATLLFTDRDSCGWDELEYMVKARQQGISPRKARRNWREFGQWEKSERMMLNG